jgi:hypothetical protein
MADERTPKAGIRGWLLLPAVGLPLGVISYGGRGYLLGDIVVPYLLGEMEYLRRWYPGSSAPGLLWAAIFEFLGCFFFAGLLVWLSVLFFGRARTAPQAWVRFLQLQIAFYAFLLIWSEVALLQVTERSVMGGSPFFDIQKVLLPIFIALFASVAAAAIWVPYFRRSRRVKATFTEEPHTDG